MRIQKSEIRRKDGANPRETFTQKQQTQVVAAYSVSRNLQSVAVNPWYALMSIKQEFISAERTSRVLYYRSRWSVTDRVDA